LGVLSSPALGLVPGCTARPEALAGEIVGQSDGLGHRLQGGFRPRPAAADWRNLPVVIVGGGVAGLTAAWRLTRAGFVDFVVLELEQAPGGTSRSERGAVSAYPWAAHYLPAPQKDNLALVRLLTEMGVIVGTEADGEPRVAEEFLCADPQERLFVKGRWYEGLYPRVGASAEDLRQLGVFEAEVNRWVAWRDARGRRAFAIPTAAASDDPEVRALDRQSMAEYLATRGLTSARLRWYVEYACRDDYGALLADTSAWAGLFYFASRVPRAGEEAEPLITWPEGNGRLVQALHSAVASRVRTGLAVTEIVPQDAGAGVDVWAYDRRAARPLGLRAERVIFAAPQYLARYLVRPYRDRPPAHVAAFDYGPWLVANLTLRDRPRGRGFPLAWDNVLYDSPSLGYVVATHQSGPEHGPTVLTFYHAFCDADAKDGRAQLLAGDWHTWAEHALADLERAHPQIRTLVSRLDVMRWGHAMVRPRPGFVWGPERAAAAQPRFGIHWAHSDLSGLALFEEAYYHGLRAAEEVLTALGRPPKERWV
jgi:protoporphyrinogen oxidase